MKSKDRSARIAAGIKKSVFTTEERSAMKQRVQELKEHKGEGEGAVLEKIAEMQAGDREMAKRIHEIVKANAPALSPKLWYGMPAYAKGEKVVCFFQPAKKFKTRYSTLGFNDPAHLDDGNMWPTAYALMNLTSADETRIGALLKKAAS